MKTIQKIRRKSSVSGKAEGKAPRRRFAEFSGERMRGAAILHQAETYWLAMSKFRRERERCKRYTYGDQWGDVIMVDGCPVKEETYIRQQGNVPLKNNLIRRLVRNVIGTFRSQATEPVCKARDRDEQRLGETMTVMLQYNMDLNRMEELRSRMLEEYLISGFVVCRKSYGWRNDRSDCWTDYVQPNNFFIDNRMRDPRGWDCSCVGEIHDISYESLMHQFADTPDKERVLKEIYGNCADRDFWRTTWESFGYSTGDDVMDFYTPNDSKLCRVIEVWRKEVKPRYRCHDYAAGRIFKIDVQDYDAMVAAENASRVERGVEAGIPADDVALIETEWFIDEFWKFYYISPLGDVLYEGETPYEHGGHPYVFKPYPFIDGEIHSFVADVIDQQRYVNRLITLNDWVIRSSAKGVLLFPEECIPDGWDIRDVADEWSRFDGVIAIKMKNNPSGVMPKQVAANSTNIGIHDLLQMQLKFMEDISGVNGALQGKPGFSGMSASLYNQQTQNATTSLLDVLGSYSSFERDSAMKDVKNMQQFYDDKRVSQIVGKDGASINCDPRQICDTEYDITIAESTSTPTYRALANEFLMELWRANKITLQEMLKVGDFPFADALMQSVDAREAEMMSQMQQQQQRAVSPA